MNSTAKRLYIVALIILATFGISYLVKAGIEPPEVEMPAWTFHEMPLQLEKWRGEDTQLDPKIAEATGADVIVDRIYRDDMGSVISMHTAMFKDPSEGVYHAPMNCYRTNGWNLVKDVRENIQVSDNLMIPMAVTTWEKSGERVIVVYWYQLGENVVHDRYSLGNLRWKMPGKAKWPVNIKIMLQISVTDPDEAKALIMGFAERVAKWLNQPEHQRYLGQWPAV